MNNFWILVESGYLMKGKECVSFQGYQRKEMNFYEEKPYQTQIISQRRVLLYLTLCPGGSLNTLTLHVLNKKLN